VFTIAPERLTARGVAQFDRRAAGLDRGTKRLLLDDGSGVDYDDR
jgi:hypothetical protein